MSIKALQDYTYYSKYARYNKKEKRRETWNEAVDRVKEMHLKKYAPRIDICPELHEEIEWAFEQVRQKKVLGSQRALQFGGDPILNKNARIYNCLRENTPFITSQGVRTFEDYSDGDRVIVLTHKGRYMPGVVRSYGKQKLNRVHLKRGNATHTVDATANHRWILKGGTETISLKEGDRLAFGPNIFGEFCYEKATPDEKLYWAYGFVYGDGTKVKDEQGNHRWSMVRLCGSDAQYLSRFEELGFRSSSSLSLEGDIMVYTGTYLKTLPNPNDDAPCLIRAFVRGFLDADGEKNKNADSPNPFLTIQATGKSSISFIRECFPIAGVYIISEEDLTGQETNFGIREETVRFRIINGFGHTAANFTVDYIEEDIAYEIVWCLEVEEDHSFVLPFGLPTGNCTASYCDRIRFFQEAFWLLLCGCGCGVSVQKHHVAKLPSLLGKKPEKKSVKKYLVQDSIEGWADALGILLASYLPHQDFPQYRGCYIEFDYALIRPAGSSISSGSGKAPGHEPLRRSLEIIRDLLDKCLERGQVNLRSIDCYDIIMHASDAVLSGGIRRSACICIFSPDDKEMLHAKTGNWFVENPQRGRSNNSVMLLRNKTSKEDFLRIIRAVKEYGEPGFIWSDSTELLVNPCCEISFWPVDEESGKSGWAVCNLTELNGRKIKTKNDWKIAARAAAIIGTLQAGYTDFDYLDTATKKIVERESLLGCSITGMMDNHDIIFNPELQKEMAKYIIKVNEEISAKLSVRPCARATCIKPSGTSSCVLGTSSGVHPHHAKRYLRRIQANIMEAPLQHFKATNPHAVEKSVWSANDTDEIISFCVEVPDGAKTKNDLDAITLLEHVKLTQQNWVMAGCVKERCVQPWLRHNVSNTCFTSKTKFYTDQGLVNFSDFQDGQKINVLNVDGNYVPALVKNFGLQQVWELTLTNGKRQFTIETTANHIWLLVNKHTKRRYGKRYSTHLGYTMVPTYNLKDFCKSYQIPRIFAKQTCSINPTAYCHGFVFGDGSKHYDSSEKTHVKIFDKCKKSLATYFSDHCHDCSVITNSDHIYIGKLNPDWKKLPDTFDKNYLFSFIAGWFAADGTISSANDNQRIVSLTCKNKSYLEWLLKISQLVGIGVSGQINSWEQKTGYKPGETYYSITFVKSTLSDDFFINHPDKYARWLGQKNLTQNPKYFTIVDCQPTSRFEDVYCVIEPLTATFVLENNVLTHNCLVRSDEWDAVADFIYDNRKYFTGISLLPISGDKDYPQAPMCAIYSPRELVQMYGDGMPLASGLIVDGLKAFENDLWKACDAALGIGDQLVEPEPPVVENLINYDHVIAYKKMLDIYQCKMDWVRRANQFANRYFEGDVRRMTYCLKDINNWKTWLDLKREYKEIDYTTMREEEDNTEAIREWACSGNTCELR